MRRLRRNDEGIAMITAILVTMVVLMLGSVSVTMAIHNSESSGFDKRRVLAVAAAEGGLDYYASHLASNNISTIQCTINSTLTNGGVFAITTTFYNSTGTGIACPLTAMPASVLVKSVGRAQANKNPARTMQALYELSPATTAPFNNTGAIFGQGGVSLNANTNIGGSKYADADIYTNGDFSLSANSTIYGNLYVQGNVTMQSNSEVKKDLWASGYIIMKGNSRVRGNATASTSYIQMTTNSRIYGNARAATTITSGIVTGTRTQNSPTEAPPARSFPAYTYDSSAWIADGYTIRNYSNCTTAVADIVNWWGQASGKNAVRVTGGCTLDFTNSVTVKGDLGIINDGSINIQTNTKFSPATGTGPWNVALFAGMNGVTPCSFTANPNGGMKSGLNTLIWANQGCDVNINSNAAIAEGQIIGGNVKVNHSLTFQYKQVSVPGVAGGGLKQDLRYKREIISS